MRIEVPFHSQEAQDAKHFANDCGTACAAMVIEWAGKGRPDVDTLSASTPLSDSDTGLTPAWVARVLTSNGVDAEMQKKVTLEAIQAEIDQHQRPVIALVNYPSIPERMAGPDWFGGHFVVVTGVEQDTIYVNDPDFWGSQMERGKNLAIKRAHMLSALAKAPVPGCAIFVKGVTDSEGESAGAAQPSVRNAPKPPQTADHTIPVGPADVKADPLWLRAVPAGAQVRLLRHNERVLILDRPPVLERLNDRSYVWVNVTTEDGVQGWCAEKFLEAAPRPPAPRRR